MNWKQEYNQLRFKVDSLLDELKTGGTDVHRSELRGKVLQHLGVQSYWEQVERFNTMYTLPTPDRPTAIDITWLEKFVDILKEELNEVYDIFPIKDPVQQLVAMADWLGDLIVYCSTESRRHGIPMNNVLKIIMASNFSKLGADGLPIFDERGKVMKGPGYWKPEPKIEELIVQEMAT